MNVENENKEPVTELGLSLGYSNQLLQRRFSGVSGAGANAGTRLDFEYAATDPLSELVWSPQSGLSLKCADFSYGDQKRPLLWGEGPSNAGVSSLKKFTDEPISKDRFIISRGAFQKFCKMEGKDTPTRPRQSITFEKPVSGSSHENGRETGYLVGDANGIEGESVQHIIEESDFQKWKGELSDAKLACSPVEADELRADLRQNQSSGNQPAEDIEVLASGASCVKEFEVVNSRMQNFASPGGTLANSASVLEKQTKDKGKSAALLNKLESTSENDSQTLVNRNACGTTSKIVASESVHEVENCSQQDEHMLPKDETVSGDCSPTNCKVDRKQKKGKEKVVSEGDVNERMSKEKEDSHESVESCNSTGLFSSSKKRCNYDQQLTVGNKKAKRQIHESPGSASYVKQDSSFMNWISNMMRGLSRSNEDKTPSLALTLAHPDPGHERHEQKLIEYRTSHDQGGRTIGFQSIFQSMYCLKTTVRERTADDAYQEELEHRDQPLQINATPLACHGENENLFRQSPTSNERSRNELSPATQPNISSEGKGGADATSSIDKHKTSNSGKVDSEPPGEAKTGHDLGQPSNPLGSLWITRFTANTAVPVSNLEHRNAERQVIESSMNIHRFFPHSQNTVMPPNDQEIADAEPETNGAQPVVANKEVQECVVENEASVGCNTMKSQNEQMPTHKLNPILPSVRLKNSEAMASVFAKRLDALKNFMPSDDSDDAACATLTCLYCGKKGHCLQDCAEIADGELEDLLRNIKSYDRAEELPCLCIRCFQLNHWAAECPNVTSRGHSQSQYGDSNPRQNNKSNAKDCFASSSGENKYSQSMLFLKSINTHISEVPKEIFDAIKCLRLSRIDILKWLNSDMPLEHLIGFYLRLRLGKWEEGLGGTGYFVACIIGVERQSSPNPKNLISVNVGGIKCAVESQYISNHDFLQDELMAWWSATTKSSTKIPSEEDLKAKINQRKVLGL